MTMPDHNNELRERLHRVEVKLENLTIVVARGRGILITIGVIFGAVAGSLLSWVLRNN